VRWTPVNTTAKAVLSIHTCCLPPGVDDAMDPSRRARSLHRQHVDNGGATARHPNESPIDPPIGSPCLGACTHCDPIAAPGGLGVTHSLLGSHGADGGR
jgi:hypothetical protein